MNEHLQRFVELLKSPPGSARAAYDGVAGQYDHYEQAWLRVAGAAAIHRVEAILAERLPAAACVLDAGAGTGAASARVLATGRVASLISADLSFQMLRTARQRLPTSSAHLVQADLVRLPFSDNQFDTVVSTWVLETLANPRAGAAELIRVVRPDGVVVCAFSSAYYDPTDRLVYAVSPETGLGYEQQLILAHEFTHALQDQYFDLTALTTAARK